MEQQSPWIGPGQEREAAPAPDDVRTLRQWFAARTRALRRHCPQEGWAKRYGLSPGALRDLEQGRVLPSRAMVVLLQLIELYPEMAERAAKDAAPQLAALEHARSVKGG